MIDQNLKRRMEMMSPRDLKQFAMLHKNDPFVVSMAVDIDNTRKAAQRQQAMQMASASQGQPPVVDQNLAAIGMPEGGIPVLPAQNMEGMADGGIVGYATGGKPADQDKETYREYAMRKAREYNLDPKLVNRIFEIESDYDPTAKSGTGPRGIGQLTSYIAKRFGISPKERTDPYKNMDASIAFMDYLNKKYKGDPAKIAVAYNQGEPVLDSHLKRNKGKLVPETLHEDVKTENKQEPAKYLEKMAPVLAQAPAAPAAPREVPRTPEMLARQQEAIRRRKLAEAIPFIGAAQAAEPQMSVPPKPASPEDRFSDLSVPTPASMAAERKRAEAARTAPSSFFDKLYGAAEAAHATVLGAPATAAGLVALDPVARYLAPKTEKGKEYAYNVHKALVEEGKLPPYVAGIGVPRAPTRAPAAREAAGFAAETAKAARERTNAPEALTFNRPVPKKDAALMEQIQAARAADKTRQEFSIDPSAIPEDIHTAVANRIRSERAAKAEKVAKTAEGEAALAGDTAEAATLADRLAAQRQGRLAGIEQLTSVPGLAGEAAGISNVPPAPTKRPYEAWEEGFVDRDRTPPAPTPLEEEKTPAAETPAAKTGLGALTDEDWLTMGLHMLQAPAGQTGSALSQLASNVGRSGLATLGEKRAREQRELDRMYRQTMEGYYKGLTSQLGKDPEEIRTLKALQGDPKLMEAYRQMQEARDITGQRARSIQQFFSAQMMGQLPADMTLEQWLAKVGDAGNTNLFSVVGSRPSP